MRDCWRGLAAAGLAYLCLSSLPSAADTDELALIALGRALFHDQNLSLQRTQSCATCHAPERAFTDPRRVPAGGAVSLGADGESLGRRNAPTLTYSAYAPVFGEGDAGLQGGLFHDGRAATLLEQVRGPIHEPTEMAMPDAGAVAERLREQSTYLETLAELHPEADWSDDEQLYEHALRAIVAFERSSALSSFDSKYDRFLAGQYEMTLDERMGRELFFSDFTNCRQCHLQHPDQRAEREPFSSYRYFNIGVPANPALPRQAGPDGGLAENQAIPAKREHRGQFRVPTLRNVAVTGPYMHNGVFKDLETAVRFYAQHVIENDFSQRNPETGQPWAEPEVPETVDDTLLPGGQPIGPVRVRQLVAFLRTLTDERYQALLPPFDQR